MSPEPASEVSGEDVLIAVSLIGVTDFDINSVTLLLDGSDVTEQAYIDSDMVSYLIDRIDPGDHEVSLIIKAAVEPLVWGFKIFSKDPLVNYSGKIKSSSSMDQIDSQTLSINKMTLDFKGSAYEWLSFKTNLKLTSQEDQFYRPRNIYGFSFGMKDILKLNLGDSNPRISLFTINGKRICLIYTSTSQRAQR